MLDVEKFVGDLQDYIGKSLRPLADRIKALEDRAPVLGRDGKDGRDGIDGKDGERGLDGQKGLQGERGEKGEPGAPGKDGRDAEPVEIQSVVKELLSAPELRTLIDLHVAEGVQRHFEEHPIKDGKDGERGPQGEKGLDGERGPQGEKGLDGVGMAGALIDREGTLVITTTKGEAIKLGAVIGKDGAPGRDGKDGADFTDAEIDYDGERTIVIRGKGGELKKRLPIPMDRGYWREGMACEKGDIVTHGGNAFIALRDNASKPCVENSDDWRIFARKGRDGATGPAGKDYVPPAPVKLGSRNA